MADDPRINWRLADRFGVWMPSNPDSWAGDNPDSAADIWNSGRATDVLIRPEGNLVVATDNGGIWLLGHAPGSGATPVSNRWPDAAFTSLAQGPDGAEHVFAGGTNAALYMTDVSQLLPLLNWVRLDSLRKIVGVGTIWDLLVLPLSRVIVAACDGGIFWAQIGPAPAKGGPPAADTFKWRQASIEGDLSGGFYGLAEGFAPPHRNPNGPILDTVIAGGLGAPSPGGIFIGRWETPVDLVFRRSNLFNAGSDVTLAGALMTFAVVATFSGDRHIGYAASATTFDDALFEIFKTQDGGKTWHVVDPKLPGYDFKKRFAEAFGTCQKGRNICIAVSNTDPDVVALGFKDGAISFDGGHTWRKPGFDPTQAIATSKHLHGDRSRLAFAPAGVSLPETSDSFYVTSDGGLAQVRWGDGAWLIESDRREGGHQGNLYAVILDGNNLVLWVRHSGGAKKFTWEVESVITSKATGAGCLIQSTFAGGDASNRNLEAIVPEDNNLVHYWCVIQRGRYTNWQRAVVITKFATGPGCLIQSSITTGDDGNFEVVALEGNELVHYWRNNGAPGFPWHRGGTISTTATSAGCLIQSNLGSGDDGSLDVIVREGAHLVHYWLDNSAPGSPWQGPEPIHPADSAGCFIQSDYGDNGNFELVFRQGTMLMHSFRDNDDPGYPWSPPVQISASGHKICGPACFFQGNYGSDDVHGNFELLVPESGAVVQYFRDNGRAGYPWAETDKILQSAYTMRSNFNRELATLEFFPAFGASMLSAGALAGPLQDNGVVDAIAGDDGTPWFQLDGGDANAGFYLSGHSSKIPGDLTAGYEAVDQNNDIDADALVTGSKSAHFNGVKLVADYYPGRSGSVIPLLIPKPGVTPIPPPELGLRQGTGPDLLYAVVRSPENFPKSMILAALAAQGADLYVLLVAQDVGPIGRRLLGIDMHWEYAATLAGTNSVNALASANGLIALAELAQPDPAFGPNFVQVDLSKGGATPMPVDPIFSQGAASSIAVVSDDEAYATVNGSELSGTTANRVVCWDGSTWSERGQPTVPTDGKLISIVTDPDQNPATLFACTASKVYISRDSAKTWARASAGLPEALSCKALHWVRDPWGSHVYVATWGRSIWQISTRETW